MAAPPVERVISGPEAGRPGASAKASGRASSLKSGEILRRARGRQVRLFRRGLRSRAADGADGPALERAGPPGAPRRAGRSGGPCLLRAAGRGSLLGAFRARAPLGDAMDRAGRGQPRRQRFAALHPSGQRTSAPRAPPPRGAPAGTGSRSSTSRISRRPALSRPPPPERSRSTRARRRDRARARRQHRQRLRHRYEVPADRQRQATETMRNQVRRIGVSSSSSSSRTNM
jgi:hypothetical protein